MILKFCDYCAKSDDGNKSSKSSVSTYQMMLIHSDPVELCDECFGELRGLITQWWSMRDATKSARPTAPKKQRH